MRAPLKKPGCTEQHASEPHCQPWFRIRYHHKACGVSWEDEWSCACDSECPRCGMDIEALDWEAIAICACECK
jgi:hypothetical protein